jgi:hypothetical protein
VGALEGRRTIIAAMEYGFSQVVSPGRAHGRLERRIGSVIRMPRWPMNEEGLAQVFPEQLSADALA